MDRTDEKYTEEYISYIRSKKWKSFREKVLKERNYKCKHCHKTFASDQLHLHHKTYKNLFHETGNDVMVLCKDCHEKLHKGISTGRYTYKYKKRKEKYPMKLSSEEKESLARLITEREEKNEDMSWHDVKEELPRSSQHIIIQTSDCDISQYGFFWINEKKFTKSWEDEKLIHNVVAWMYMPETSDKFFKMPQCNG